MRGHLGPSLGVALGADQADFRRDPRATCSHDQQPPGYGADWSVEFCARGEP